MHEEPDYVATTGDRVAADRLKERLVRYVEGCRRRVGADGLYVTSPCWHIVDYSRSDKLVKGVNYPLNFLFAATLEAMDRLYGLPDWAAEAKRIRSRAMERSWNGRRFRDCAGSEETTEAAQYYAFLFGGATRETHAALWQELLASCTAPNTSAADLAPGGVYMAALLRFRLLAEAKEDRRLVAEAKSRFGHMARETGTMWERYDTAWSCCHGFNGCFAAILLQRVLGIRSIDFAAKTVHVVPTDPGLAECRVTLPVPDGLVEYGWTVVNGHQERTFKGPPGWTMRPEAESVWRIEPGADVQGAFNAAIDAARAAGGGTIELKAGEYRFRTGGQRPYDFYVSNHSPEPRHLVNLPLVGVTNLTIRGNGARLVFDGCTVGALIMDSAGVRLENLSLDWSNPFIAEMTIVGYEDGKTIGRIDRRVFPYAVENGKLVLTGAGWREGISCALLFDGKTGAVVDNTGDICDAARFAERPDGLLACGIDLRTRGAGAKVGDIVAWRIGGRLGPASVVYRSKDTVYEDVAIHGCWGMGVIAQKSENFTWRGTGDPESRRSGVFAASGSGRVATLLADATHFSNVKGLVTVENCLFERMMDDAINVHSTCLRIVAKPGPRQIRCRYMHRESIGFGVFGAGDALRRVTASPETRGFETRVTSVETHDAHEVTLTLAGEPGERLPVGAAVENADYQCAVVFRGNVVRANRARATLFTTPKSVLVADNLFEDVMMATILFEGDCAGWYESGSCRDVLVTNNVFRHCCSSWDQYCPAVVVVNPGVADGFYHRNLRFVGNRFETHDVPLLSAHRTDGLVWTDNVVVRDNSRRAIGWPAFDVEGCRNISVDGYEQPVTRRLFNGRDLSGWYSHLKGRGKNSDPNGVFTVTNGVIRISGEELGALVSEEEFADYRLSVEFRFTDGRQYAPKIGRAPDSGILFHSTGPDGAFDGAWMAALECNLARGAIGDLWCVDPGAGAVSLSSYVGGDKLSDGAPICQPWASEMRTVRGNGRICNRDISRAWQDRLDVPVARNERPTGAWNWVTIVCLGDHVTTVLNGRPVNFGFNVRPTRGRIQLQSEGNAVEFRQVLLTPLARSANWAKSGMRLHENG